MRAIIFESLSEFRRKFTGPFLRRIGKKMYQTGTAVEGENASEDRLVPSLRKLTYAGF